MERRSGEHQDLGDGWAGAFEYTLTSRGWVPSELRVWHDGDDPMPVTGLPVRRLRTLSASRDIAALNEVHRPAPPVAQMSAAERRSLSGRLSALGGYDSLRFMGRNRAEAARAMNVSEAWLKWLLSWGRQHGYLSSDGQLTEEYALAMARGGSDG